MRTLRFWLVVATALALATGAHAATTMWLSTDTAGTPIPGDSINVPSGGTVQLHAFLNSADAGNVFEMMIGYDNSNATTYGAGVDTNNGGSKKLTLASTEAAIEASMPASFTVLKSAVLDASGRESLNSYIGGRPYGFVGRAATYANAAPGKIECFAFTLQNNMASGDFHYVVLSSSANGNSYCDAWKFGTTLSESSYALKVVSGSATPKSTYGVSGKTLNDTMMSTAASNYNWVMWGSVKQVIDANTLTIDDGSGVIVKVSKTAHGRAVGDYVSARGTLDLSTNPPVLTATEVIKRN